MGSLSHTITECTMFACLAFICVACFSAVNALEDNPKILSEIDIVTTEAKSLAEELTDLLIRFEIEGEDMFQNEELYKEIIDKIKEEEFQNSVANLQQLATKLEEASLSTNSKFDKESKLFEIMETATK